MSQPIARKRRLVDLSVTLDNNPYTDPPPLLPKIDYMDHQQGWPEMAAMFPGLQLEQMPGNESWAAEPRPPTAVRQPSASTNCRWSGACSRG